MEAQNMRLSVAKVGSLLAALAFCANSVLGYDLSELIVPGSEFNNVRWSKNEGGWAIWTQDVVCGSGKYLYARSDYISDATCDGSGTPNQRRLLISQSTLSDLSHAYISNILFVDLQWDHRDKCWFVGDLQCLKGYDVELSNKYTLGNLVDGYWENMVRCVYTGRGSGTYMGTVDLPKDPNGGCKRGCVCQTTQAPPTRAPEPPTAAPAPTTTEEDVIDYIDVYVTPPGYV